MIIRSQDKRIIANLDNCMRIEIIKCDGYFAIGSYESTRYARLGQYSIEEKAIKVLDMIQSVYNAIETMKIDGGAWRDNHYFEMPQDSEV